MRFNHLLSSTSLPEKIPLSPLETRRFGLRVGRLELGGKTEVSPEALRDRILASDLELVILRYPTRFNDWFARLLHPRLEVIFADTLIYYSKNLTAVTSPTPPAEVEVVEVGREDLPELESIVRELFVQYRNHYASNPRLDPSAIIAGYCEWASSCVDRPGAHALLLEQEGRPVGMVTFDEGEPAEIGLVGVIAECRRQGLLNYLMLLAEWYAHQAGCQQMVISTQAQNTPVQRVWTRGGYRAEMALTTVHLMLRSADEHD